MAVKTIAEKLHIAYLTGQDADFIGDDGDVHLFTPEGLKNYISGSSEGVSWDDVMDKPDVVVRDEDEQVTVPVVPTANTHAASKSYVDSEVTTLEGLIEALELRITALETDSGGA